MTTFLILTAFIISSVCLQSCNNADKKQTSQVILKNECDIPRELETLVINRDELKCNDKHLLPLLLTNNRDTIICQHDDLNKDGEWDELSFLYSIKGRKSDTLQIEWVSRNEYPVFDNKTNIIYGRLNDKGVIAQYNEDKYDKHYLPRGKDYPYQMDGPTWENDKIAFRHYFDGRNCRDIFGKTINELVMDTVGINKYGKRQNTYSTMNNWGRDILTVGQSLGIGGTALSMKDTLIRAGILINDTVNNIDSTYFKKIVTGPVRSIFKIKYKGWNVYDKKINVEETITINAGEYGYYNKISCYDALEGAFITTGLVNIETKKKPNTFNYSDKLFVLSSYDKQANNHETYLGMSIILPLENYKNIFDANDVKSNIKDTWCISMVPDKNNEYWYYACAGWEKTDSIFKDEKDYNNMVQNIAIKLANPIKMTIK